MDFKDYIRGERKGKDANQLERKAMNDPFLQDAIDGYDSMEGNHISMIEELEKRVSTRRKTIDKRVWILAAAASIALLVGIPLLLHKSFTNGDSHVTSSDLISSEIIHKAEEISPSTLDDDSLLIANLNLDKEEDKTQKPDHVISPTLSGKSTQKTVKPKSEEILVAETKIVREENELVEEKKVINIFAINDILDGKDKKEIVEEKIGIDNKQLQLTTQHLPENIKLSDSQQHVVEALAGRAAGIITSDSKQNEENKVFYRGIATPHQQSDILLVSGRIVDETGEPIPGVTINISDTPIGTVSKVDGSFQLTVPKGKEGKLIASFIGMNNSEIPLKENVGDIKMTTNELALNEVVVVGYGSQKKKTSVGAVAKVKNASTTATVTSETNAMLFGEKEFKKYFIENYDKSICSGEHISFSVAFFIDDLGRPGNINIKENSCPSLENEIKRLLLGSPKWSQRNSKITMQMQLPWSTKYSY